MPSSFGSLLTHLVRFPTPTRASQHPLSADSSDCLSIPKELWRIIDFIYKKGIDAESLFLHSGVQDELESIREALDTGSSFDNQNINVHSMAETLILFLESLGEPVIPFHLFEQAIEQCNTYSQCKLLVSSIHPVHFNTFYYLMSFLREILNHGNKNKLSKEKLAVVFSSVIIRSKGPILPQAIPNVVNKKAEFLKHFLENELKVG